MEYNIQDMKCCVNISAQNLFGLCGNSTHTSSFMYDNNGPKVVVIDHDRIYDGSQDENLREFNRLVELTKTSKRTAFIVALHTGGEMGSPDIETEDARIVFAIDEEDAERIYNTCTKAFYYYGCAIGTVNFNK